MSKLCNLYLRPMARVCGMTFVASLFSIISNTTNGYFACMECVSPLRGQPFYAPPSRTVPCKGQIRGDDVNNLFVKVPNLSVEERKLIQAARSSVSKEWACFMQHAEVIVRFDERNLQVKLQCGKRTNRLVIQYNHKEEVEQIWEEVGWIMWARDVCMQAYEVVVKFAPSLLGLLQPAMKLMITGGEEPKRC